MEADWLRSRLESGRSIESIAREAGKHPSTVGYWVNKHGLIVAPRATPRRPRRRSTARRSRRCSSSRARRSAQIADAAGPQLRDACGTGSRSYGLDDAAGARTRAETAPKPQRETVAATARCTAGRSFVRTGADGRFRCRLCHSGAVRPRRREDQGILVAEAGGGCALCGYRPRTSARLQFHHLDPREKAFALSGRGVTRSLAAARAEAAKCVLLCANCHAEVEAGSLLVPVSCRYSGAAPPRGTPIRGSSIGRAFGC